MFGTLLEQSNCFVYSIIIEWPKLRNLFGAGPPSSRPTPAAGLPPKYKTHIFLYPLFVYLGRFCGKRGQQEKLSQIGHCASFTKASVLNAKQAGC
jgi:hypothetical protein